MSKTAALQLFARWQSDCCSKGGGGMSLHAAAFWNYEANNVNRSFGMMFSRKRLEMVKQRSASVCAVLLSVRSCHRETRVSDLKLSISTLPHSFITTNLFVTHSISQCALPRCVCVCVSFPHYTNQPLF